jgi:hypothetical protein
MSRKITLPLADRRELTARRVAWGLRWITIDTRQRAALAAGADLDGGGPAQITRSPRGKAALLANAKATTVRHHTSVRADSTGKFIASCSCSWSSRPLTERGAKGQATRHANGAAAEVPAAA